MFDSSHWLVYLHPTNPNTLVKCTWMKFIVALSVVFFVSLLKDFVVHTAVIWRWKSQESDSMPISLCWPLALMCGVWPTWPPHQIWTYLVRSPAWHTVHTTPIQDHNQSFRFPNEQPICGANSLNPLKLCRYQAWGRHGDVALGLHGSAGAQWGRRLPGGLDEARQPLPAASSARKVSSRAPRLLWDDCSMQL